MPLHQRSKPVQNAKIVLSDFMLRLEKEFDLTFAETAKILSEQISDTMKYAVRQERHPNDKNKKGDEA